MRAAGRKVAAGRREPRPAPPRQQRAEQQHRAPQSTDQHGVRLVLDHLPTSHAQRRRPDAVDLGAEIDQQTRHHLDVADQRHVGEHARFRGQQTGREQRQRRVLVALDLDPARQAVTALNP